MKVMGIDPGLEGALAVVDSDCLLALPLVRDMPVKTFEDEIEIDFDRLLAYLDEMAPDLIVVERLQGTPAFGSKNFKLGASYFAVVYAAGQRQMLRVKPQTWKGEILYGTAKDKEAAVSYIQGLYPALDLFPSVRKVKGKPKPSHDRAEAVCMALYGARLYGKQSV